jgi:hypothetical protein
MASLIKCRKCGGPHVTLKCGKEKQDLNTVLENTFTPKPIVNNYDYNTHEMNTRNTNTHGMNTRNTNTHEMSKRIDKRKIVVIKISNLPTDITVPELNELVSEWGKIGRINISSYDNSTSYIDFYFENEADYFIKAVDKTPFDNLILNVEKVIKN